MKTKIIPLFALIAITMALDLPNSFKICKRSDPKISECLISAITDAILLLSKGVKNFKLMSMDPLSIESLKIDQSSSSSIAIKQEYYNIKIHGLTKNLKILNVQPDWNNMVIKIDILHPHVDFIGDYKINGKILLLPLQGQGAIKMNFDNMKTMFEIYYETYEKNKETYMKVKKMIIKTSPERLKISLENLFNGNAELGEQMNKFINENSDIIYQELQKPFEEVFDVIFSQNANKLFSRIPMDKLFPPN